MAKKLLASAGIKTPKWFCSTDGEIPKDIQYPIIIKPLNGGSTVGITIAKNPDEFQKALKIAYEYNECAIVEEFIEGVEITVGVLNGKALPIIEIIAASGFYDYEAKYKPGGSEHIIPARISDKAKLTAEKYAEQIYKLFKCKGVCRADMLVDKNDEVWVIENNTSPGMTNVSLLPDAAKFSGMSFDMLVLRILESL
jgi:D-alanine-D-alanine ligase